jgi:hypothetical protein
MVTTMKSGYRERRGRAAILGAIGSLFLVAGTAFAYKWKDPTAAEKAIVEDPVRKLSGAVYLEISEETAGSTYHPYVFHEYVRAKILSRTGFEIGTVDDLAEDAFEVEGRTVSASGVVTPLSEKDIRTITTIKAAGVSLKRKGFTMPALEPGSFIEYSYKENGVFGSRGEFHTEIPFQRKFAILRQDLTTPHSEFQYSSAIRFENGVKIEAHQESGKMIYRAENAPAIHPEPFGMPEKERAAAVIFSYFFQDLRATSAEEYWKGATRLGLIPWVKNLLVRPSKIEDRLKSISGSRTADASARLKALYRYVQTTLKNQDALPAGETPPRGGWKKNADAGDAFARGSGTPLEILAAFVSLLRADGWAYRVVYCPDLQERAFHPQIPSIFQFDTQVVEVRDPGLPRPVYLSFEHPMTPYGVVAWNHLGTDCYAVDIEKGTAEIVQIPQSAPAQNAQRRLWTVSFNVDGDAKIVRDSHWTGQQGLEARTLFFQLGRSQYEKRIRDDYQKMDPPGDVDSVEVKNEASPDEEFVSTITFERGGLLPVSAGRIIFSPLAMFRELNPFTQDTRTEPLRFPFPHLDADSLAIHVPAGYSLEGVPQGYDSSSEAGHYVVTARQEGDIVTVDRLFELRAAAASASAYPRYRSLFETAARGDADFSLVFRKAPSASR